MFPVTSVAMALLLALAPGTGSVGGTSDLISVSQPQATIDKGVKLGTTHVPVKVSWPAATTQQAALARYELQTSRDGGPWTPVALAAPRARSATVRSLPFATLRYRLRAVDVAGATSRWVESAPLWLGSLQESEPEVGLIGPWQFVASSSSVGGRRASTAEAGATATVTFTGRTIAWVSRRGPGAGGADVSVDGGAPTHVDLKRSTWRPRRVVFTASWPTTGRHKLTIETTDPGGVVDIDAFVVLDAPRNATLVGAGDIASCTRSADEATAALAATIDGIVYTTGDNVYPDGTAANFANCYDPSWGALKSRTRPVVGNHEYNNNPGAAPYFAYFGAAAGAPGKGWYRYDAGTWRIFVLSSECSGALCTEQLSWLTAELDASPHQCVLAMWHRPRFSTGSHGDSTKMAAAWQLLHARGAEVVLTGHDHGYQRYVPLDGTGQADAARGLREFVVGTGGASLYPFPDTSPLLAIRDNTSHGVLRLSLSPGGYSWQFVPIPGDTFTDSGSAACH